MEGVVRELGGASDVPRMVSTPEPEPVEVDEPIIEEESEEDEEEVREFQRLTFKVAVWRNVTKDRTKQ